MKLKQYMQSKSIKFGGFAILFTAAVIAVVIALNAIVSGLATKYSWYFDMTSESIYSVSDESEKILSSLDTGDNHVTIYFLADTDQLGSGASYLNQYGSSSLWGMKPIHELALAMADKHEFISVDYINITKEPDKIREIVGEETYSETGFARNFVIIDNLTEYKDQNGNVYDTAHTNRIFSRDSFYCFDYSTLTVNGFRGDFRLCAGIASVCVPEDKAPSAYFVTGHGESVGPYDWTDEEFDTVDYQNAQAVWQLLRDMGYKIEKINLAYEDIPENENGSIAIVFGPKTDFIADGNSNRVNEIAKLTAFMENPKNNLMVFMDTDTRTLPNLEGYLENSFGIIYSEAKLKDNGANAITADGHSVVGIPDAVSFAEKTIFRNCRPITTKAVSGVSLTTLYKIPDSSVASYNSGKTEDVEGALLVNATSACGSRVMASSTTQLAEGTYMDSPVYANRSVLFMVTAQMSEGLQNPGSVPYKVISNENLDLTTRDALLWTIAISTVLPVVFAVFGIIVFVRRRHS